MKIFEIIVILVNEHFRVTLDLVVEQDPTSELQENINSSLSKTRSGSATLASRGAAGSFV